MDELTIWQYTAMVGEHNARSEETDPQLDTWTKEEYEREKQALRDRGDPQIQV